MAAERSFSLWPYTPSVAAAVIFILFFLGLTVAHAWRVWQTKAKFCIAFAVGGFFEFAGFAARAVASKKLNRLMPFVVQNFFILVAPALFAASIYMTLGRVIQSLRAERHSLIRFSWLTRVFVGGDMISFLVQGGAAPLMVIAEQKYMKIGEGVVIAGLFIQILMFGLFVVTSFVFERRIKSQPTEQSISDKSWQPTMHMLYSVSALIMIRSVFRVVEYIMGYDGYLLRNEWPLYVFDAVLMFGVMVLFLWRFPGNLMPSHAPVKSEEDFHGYENHVMSTKA